MIQSTIVLSIFTQNCKKCDKGGNMKNCERGRSMIEMLGVLAIVGVLSVGGIAGYSKAMKKIRSEKTTSQLHEVIMTIRNLYIHQSSYEGISVQTLIDSQLISKEMYTAGTYNSTLKSAVGGDIFLYVSKGISGRHNAFEIYATGLEKDTCVMLATLDWGSDPSSGFEALYVGTLPPESALMEDVNLPTDSIPEQGIFTPGMHSHAIPLTIPTALGACACSAFECVIGLKYT